MMFTFNCYFPAETPLFIMIDIDSNTLVKRLLKAVAAELKEEGRTDLKVRLSELLQQRRGSKKWGT